MLSRIALARQARRALLAVAAVVASSFAAEAGDLSRPAPASPYAAPTRARVGDWSGAYVGAAVGLSASALESSGSEPNIPALKFSGRKNTSGSAGVDVGVRAGYNFQSDRLVYGVEGEIDAATGQHKKASGHLRADRGPTGAVKARVGYGFDNTLVFATAGIAATRFDLDSPAVGATPASKRSQTKIGPVIGVGIEHKLSERLSVRGDLDLAGFGEKRTRFASGSTDIGAAELTATVGVSYRF